MENFPFLLAKQTVLFIDHDPEGSLETRVFLATRVNAFYWAKNGKEALDLFHSHNPDIVIADAGMPGLNGLALAKLMRQTRPRLPVILTTPFDQRANLMQAVETGIGQYVLKPLNPKRLLHALYHCVELLGFNERIIRKSQTSRSVIETLDPLLLVTDGVRTIGCNKRFLHFFGYKDLETFSSEHHHLGEFLIREKEAFLFDDPLQNWLHKALTSQNGPAKVKLFDATARCYRVFLLKTSRFPVLEEEYVVSLVDITPLENRNAMTGEQHRYDPLTQVLTKGAWLEALDLEVKRSHRYHNNIGMILVAIRFQHEMTVQPLDFKRINHHNRAVVHVASTIGHMVRTTDVVGRLEPELFGILTIETPTDGSSILAHRLSASLKHHFSTLEMAVSVTIGVSAMDANDTLESFFQRGRQCLKSAQEEPGFPVVVVPPAHAPITIAENSFS